MSLPSVGAVIVTYNTGERLSTLVTALVGQVAKVYFIDNDSDNQTLALLQSARLAHPDLVEVIQQSKNIGLAAAQNIGISKSMEAGFQYTLLLDDDSLPHPNMVHALIAAHQSWENTKPVAMMVPSLSDTHDTPPTILVKGKTRPQPAPTATSDCILNSVASGSLILNAVLTKTGLMMDLFIDSIDTEFCLRLAHHGYSILYVPSAKLTHQVGTPEKRPFLCWQLHLTHHPPLRYYYIARNRLITWRLYGHEQPHFVFFEIKATVLHALSMLLCEKQKWAKTKAILSGLFAGATYPLLRHQPPPPNARNPLNSSRSD